MKLTPRLAITVLISLLEANPLLSLSNTAIYRIITIQGWLGLITHFLYKPYTELTFFLYFIHTHTTLLWVQATYTMWILLLCNSQTLVIPSPHRWWNVEVTSLTRQFNLQEAIKFFLPVKTSLRSASVGTSFNILPINRRNSRNSMLPLPSESTYGKGKVRANCELWICQK